MSRAWKEIAEGWRLFARRAEKGNCRPVAPLGKKSLGAAEVS